jgi:hypothetical protein
MVSHNQQNSTNPWIGWVLSLTYSNLTLVMVGHNQPTNPWVDWAGHVGLMLVVTDYVQGWLG